MKYTTVIDYEMAADLVGKKLYLGQAIQSRVLLPVYVVTQVDKGKVALVSITGGNRWDDPIPAKFDNTTVPYEAYLDEETSRKLLDGFVDE